MGAIPLEPKLYHIVHHDRLPSIIFKGGLYCDAVMSTQEGCGTTIGMTTIKADRRIKPLQSYPDMCVGDCVPFYFCPRSVMLYLISRRNADGLDYQGGQGPIVHLEFPLRDIVRDAGERGARWAFTDRNARTNYSVDYRDLSLLDQLNWDAITARQWGGEALSETKEGKQAEFLVERFVPWGLVRRIGVYDVSVQEQVSEILQASSHRPQVHVMRAWYY